MNATQFEAGGSVYNCKDAQATKDILRLAYFNSIAAPVGGHFVSSDTYTYRGITIQNKGNGLFHISGTADTTDTINIIDTENAGLPAGFVGGAKLPVLFTFTGNNFGVEFWSKSDATGSTWSRFGTYYTSSTEYRVLSGFPANSQGLLARVVFTEGSTYDFDFTLIVLSCAPGYEALEKYVMESEINGLDEPDLNNVLGNRCWLLYDDITYTNKPAGFPNLGFLQVVFTGNWHLQVLYPFEVNKNCWYRRGNSTGTSWTEWIPLNTWGYDGELLETNLNNVTSQGWWLLNDSHTYTNVPGGFTLGFLCSVFTGSWRLQLLYQFTGGKIFKRRGNSAGSSWEEWKEISGGGNTYNVTNEYSYPSYSQSVTLNASPTITSDTNNYLAPSGDDTDRTADILAMLSSNKVCRLGPGKFVVSNLQMPAGSALIGSGHETLVRFAGTSDGYAIRMTDYCCVRDMHIIGAESNPTFTSTIGGRHGIMWQGNAQQSGANPYKGMINNVWLDNFTGGGITCYNTGYGTVNALEVVNAYITRCWAGINISYWSEFHKFTNVRCEACYIACVNNGGNNVFVNCDFSTALEIGMLMDNSQGQSPNNTHGSCVGCVFNHTGHAGQSNAGVGIKILNCHSGFVFSGCQIFYSQIVLEDTDGVIVADTNFGNNNCNVSIVNGGATLFANCMTEGAIPVTIDNNNHVHFANCYNKFTGATWSA